MALGQINCDYERWQMDVKALSHYFCLSVRRVLCHCGDYWSERSVTNVALMGSMSSAKNIVSRKCMSWCVAVVGKGISGSRS